MPFGYQVYNRFVGFDACAFFGFDTGDGRASIRRRYRQVIGRGDCLENWSKSGGAGVAPYENIAATRSAGAKTSGRYALRHVINTVGPAPWSNHFWLSCRPRSAPACATHRAADMTCVANVTAGTWNFGRDADVPNRAQCGKELKYSLKASCTAADASLATNDQVQMRWLVEGYDWQKYFA